MVGLGRVELPTYGLGNRRSIHLSYSPIMTYNNSELFCIPFYVTQGNIPSNFSN